ncbi:MAG: hypothetical protein U0787_16475 [Polyangia bacterium]|mgnify:FL=1
MRPVFALPLSLLLLAGACAPKDDPVPDEQMMVPKVETKFVIRFKLSDFVRGQIPKDSTVKGTVYGDLFLSEDVAITGPRKGAMAAASVELPIDLKTDKLSTASITTKPLAAQTYTFLGFFDIGDKSTPASRDPVTGDPVTLPFTNKFTLADGQTMPISVTFDLLYN